MLIPSAGTPLINAVTATTSGVFDASAYENITVHFHATGISAGNGVLTVLGSNDGVNFVAVVFVDPTVTNTNAQNLTRIASLTLSSNTDKVAVIENIMKFQFIKLTMTFTTDGTYSVFVSGDLKRRS